jgi:hypothetical protein
LDQVNAAEQNNAESTKAVIVQVDDLLTFRQFSKLADDAIDVSIIDGEQLELGYVRQMSLAAQVIN